jgi:hypothetical protein
LSSDVGDVSSDGCHIDLSGVGLSHVQRCLLLLLSCYQSLIDLGDVHIGVVELTSKTSLSHLIVSLGRDPIHNGSKTRGDHAWKNHLT